MLPGQRASAEGSMVEIEGRSTAQHEIHLAVADRGPGIPASELEAMRADPPEAGFTTSWPSSFSRTTCSTLAAQANTFRWANDGDVNSMDPYARNETFLLTFNQNIYDPLVRRGQLEYARIRAGHPLMERVRAAIGGSDDTLYYARRCVYRRRQGLLLVTEVFLPSVLDLKPAGTQPNTK